MGKSWAASSLFLCLLTGSLASAEVTEHLVSRMEELSVGVHSYKAAYDLTLQMEKGPIRMKGLLLYKWPASLRNEMSVDGPLGLHQMIYWREGILWQYLPASKVAFRQEEAKLREQFPQLFASQELLNLRSPFEMAQPHSIQLIREEPAEGGEGYYLFEAVPKKAIQSQGVLSPQLCRFRISSQDGLLRDFLMYNAHGQEIYAQHFWDIQINLELLDEEFQFHLPDDVEVVDVTKKSKERLEAMAKGASL